MLLPWSAKCKPPRGGLTLASNAGSIVSKSLKTPLKGGLNFGTIRYAFHLMNIQWTFNFMVELANITNTFIIITPSKKIYINHPSWCISKELRIDKVTLIILNTNHQNYIK